MVHIWCCVIYWKLFIVQCTILNLHEKLKWLSLLLAFSVPSWLKRITLHIFEESQLFPSPINHVLINEYLPNQGIMVCPKPLLMSFLECLHMFIILVCSRWQHAEPSFMSFLQQYHSLFASLLLNCITIKMCNTYNMRHEYHGKEWNIWESFMYFFRVTLWNYYLGWAMVRAISLLCASVYITGLSYTFILFN